MQNLINPLKTLIRPKQRDEENSKVEKKTTKRTGEERKKKGNEVKPLDSRSIKAPPSQGARVNLSSEDRVAFRTADKQLEKAVNLLSKGKQKEATQALEKVSKALGSIAERNTDKKQLVPRWFAACALPLLVVKNDTLDRLKNALDALPSKEGNEVLQQLAKLVNQAIKTSAKSEALYNIRQAQNKLGSDSSLRKVEKKLADELIAVAKSYPSTHAGSSPDAVIPGMRFTLKQLMTIKADATEALTPLGMHAVKAELAQRKLDAEAKLDPHTTTSLVEALGPEDDLDEVPENLFKTRPKVAENASRIERENHDALENAEQQLGHAVEAVLARDPLLAQQSIELVSEALELIAQRHPHEPDLIRRLCGECLRDAIPHLDQNTLEALDEGLAPLLADRAKYLKERSNARRAQPAKDFPDSVSLILFQLNFSVKAQLLLLKADAMVKQDIGFGKAEVYATSDWPEEELIELNDIAVHVVQLAESYPPADTTLPGAQLTMAQVRAIERAALMARNALDMVPKWEKAADRRAIDLVEKAAYTPVKNMSGAELKALKEAVNRLMAKSDEDDLDDEGYLEPEQLTKLDAQIQEAEKVITVRVIGPVHVFDTSKLSGEKLDALLAEIAALVHVPRALMKAKREILAQRLTTAKAEFQTALKEALRETYRGRTADTLLRSAVKAQTAMDVFARLGKTLDTRTLSRWTQEAVRAEKKKNGTAGLQAMQNSLALGEGKAIRDLLSKRAVSGPVTALSYLGVLSDVLTASLPVGAASSAQSSTGATVLSVDAQAALLRHLGVDALPHPFDNADDLDVAIAIAEAGLELALRKGVVDLVHAEKLILQIPLVLSVTKDVDALTALKKLANSVIKAVGNQDAQTASDAQAVANMVDAKLAQDGAKTRTKNGPSKLGVMNTRLKGRSIEAPTPDPKRVQFEKSREKKFPDPVIHPLEFSAKAELLRRKTDALEMRGTVFGGKNQHPVTALPEADLRELRDLYDLASELVEEAKAIAIGRRQDDAELPGTKFTLNKLERIQAYALDASDALGVR